MTEPTPRDRVWLRIIDALRHHASIRSKDIAEDEDVAVRTARNVLHIAEDAGLLDRESEEAHWYHPAVGFAVEHIEDPDYARAIESLIDEATED